MDAVLLAGLALFWLIATLVAGDTSMDPAVHGTYLVLAWVSGIPGTVLVSALAWWEVGVAHGRSVRRPWARPCALAAVVLLILFGAVLASSPSSC